MIHPPKCVSRLQPIAMIAFLIDQFAKNLILLCANSMLVTALSSDGIFATRLP